MFKHYENLTRWRQNQFFLFFFYIEKLVIFISLHSSVIIKLTKWKKHKYKNTKICNENPCCLYISNILLTLWCTYYLHLVLSYISCEVYVYNNIYNSCKRYTHVDSIRYFMNKANQFYNKRIADICHRTRNHFPIPRKTICLSQFC